MARVIVQEYDDTIVLMYPLCPYANPKGVPDEHNGVPYVDYWCNHPRSVATFCGTHHYRRYTCPFDIHKELYGKSRDA